MEISVLSYFALALQFSLGIVFLLSALPKLREPLAFVGGVVKYKIFPPQVARVFAFGLIPLEVFLAVAFLTGGWNEIALPIAGLFLSLFLIAVAINLRQGRSVPCGCFGNGSEMISSRTLARLLLLLMVTLFLAVFRSTSSASLPNLAALIADLSTLIYFIQTVFLSIFFILLSVWILNLPQLISLDGYLRQSQLSAKNARNKNIEEGL